MRSLVFLAAAVAPSLAAAPFPTNNDPTRQIRFDAPADADARREELIRFIWPEGMPSESPNVTEGVAPPSELATVEASLIERIDRLDCQIADWDLWMTVYVLHPARAERAERLALVQQGHAHDLGGGVDRTIAYLLSEGLTVATMQMPLAGWNVDHDGRLASGLEFDFAEQLTRGHNEVFAELAETIDGQAFRFFLEPIVETVNWQTRRAPGAEVAMIGLSGGGWTTSMAAAVDVRIDVSIPVAGSSPLYHRNVDPGSRGDAEQYYEPLYNEDVAADGSGGGVATWLEIYALGGYGPGRKQVMVTNLGDTCCFSGTFADEFKEIVREKVASLGDGAWEYYRDESHAEHKISDHLLAEIVRPALGLGGEPTIEDAE